MDQNLSTSETTPPRVGITEAELLCGYAVDNLAAVGGAS